MEHLGLDACVCSSGKSDLARRGEWGGRVADTCGDRGGSGDTQRSVKYPRWILVIFTHLCTHQRLTLVEDYNHSGSARASTYTAPPGADHGSSSGGGDQEGKRLTFFENKKKINTIYY